MVEGGVYVDDSGNPGVESGSDFLSSTRKSWTAVIVPSSIEQQVTVAMEMFLKGIFDDFGAVELHFTDIYSGRGSWRNVPVGKRIEIFELMQMLLDYFQLPVIHQTASEESYADAERFWAKVRKAEGVWWDIKEVSHLGFLMLCHQLARYLRELHQDGPQNFKLPMPLFVDEGLAKAGVDVELPNWGDVIEGPKVQFRESHKTPGIQIADFAAFAISRTQWVMAKQELGSPVKEADLKMLQTTSNMNILNLPKLVMNVENISKKAYEFGLMKDRKNKGLSPRPKSPKRK
ncbi:DUF3800 domain-containing protein [Altererythrobacter sp. MF3-039]|uniref:DUF3800 domain-containing protein n=1 Tax=Altererythrobacter sp. MF3-039 TaxID=3252901 RepID=UPI00390CCC8D